jgi:hypothetical protein
MRCGYAGAWFAEVGEQHGELTVGAMEVRLHVGHGAVQVKTGQAGVDEYRAFRGVMEYIRAEQGLLVAWGGFPPGGSSGISAHAR